MGMKDFDLSEEIEIDLLQKAITKAEKDFGQDKGLGWYFRYPHGVTPLRDVIAQLDELDRALFGLDIDACGDVVAEVHVSAQVFKKIVDALEKRYSGTYKPDAEGRIVYECFALKPSDKVPFDPEVDDWIDDEPER